MSALPVGPASGAFFGPGVIDKASVCPASAAVELHGYYPARGVRAYKKAPMGAGAWPDTVALLDALAGRGPTDLWSVGTHPVEDLNALAAGAGITGPSASYAVPAAENVLDAQAATGLGFSYVPGFVKVPFHDGSMHAGGVLAFQGPHGAWQGWRLRVGEDLKDGLEAHLWAALAAAVLAKVHGAQLASVDIFEVSGLTGRSLPLGAWTVAEALTHFESAVQPRLQSMAHRLDVSPGSHCASCTFAGACHAAPAVGGLLDGVPRQRHVTAVSASDLQDYARCPHRRLLLSQLRLPRTTGATTDAMARGIALDQWLTRNHARGVACEHADLDALTRAPLPAGVLEGARRHLDVCPVHDADAGLVQVEPKVAAVDAASGVLLVARPDATYTVQGERIWRETKSRGAITVVDAQELVESDITAATYLTLLAAQPAGGTLEWEQVSHDDANLLVLPTDDTGLLESARRHVSAAVADMLADQQLPPRPGLGCTSCPVRQWCTAAP